jgi:hypothetical protein
VCAANFAPTKFSETRLRKNSRLAEQNLSTWQMCRASGPDSVSAGPVFTVQRWWRPGYDQRSL